MGDMLQFRSHRMRIQTRPRIMGKPRVFGGRSAFTLIEILVVVAIIGLLVAVLMPALKQARELSKAVVCLSHLEQLGVALKVYSHDSKGVFPWAGSFRFSLMEGKYYVGYEKTDPTWIDWGQVNIGVLFPRYVGNTTDLYYCPNNLAVDHNGYNGKDKFLYCYRHQKPTDPMYHTSHDFPFSPFTAYCYAPPVVQGKSPRDAGKNVYPEESTRFDDTLNGQLTDKKKDVYPYWKYLNDPNTFDASFPGPTTKDRRGNHLLHALVSDGYYAGKHEGDHSIYEGYHLKAYNVLYSDFHAKRVSDPYGKIHAAKLTPIRPDRYDKNEIMVYRIWDYFSANP